MQAQNTVAQLFHAEPGRWGLRGDPYLWRDMRDVLTDTAYPSTEAQFATLLEQTYRQLTGGSLMSREPIFIERYSHGGMSSGYVSPQFWIETAIPLLLARYRATPVP